MQVSWSRITPLYGQVTLSCSPAQNSYTVHPPPWSMPTLSQSRYQGKLRSSVQFLLSIVYKEVLQVAGHMDWQCSKKRGEYPQVIWGKINFLFPPVCCLRQNSCSVLSVLPSRCQTARQLPPSSPFASNTSHLLLCLSPSESSDISNYRNAK